MGNLPAALAGLGFAMILGSVWAMFARRHPSRFHGYASACLALLAGWIGCGVYEGLREKDFEILSGRIETAMHRPAWTEYYEYAVYRTETYTAYETQVFTDSEGRRSQRQVPVRRTRRVFDHWQPTTRTHAAWWATRDSFNRETSISQAEYARLKSLFGGEESRAGDRRTNERASRMIAGDPLDYALVNRAAWIEPVTLRVAWDNPFAGKHSLYDANRVTNRSGLHDYPTGTNRVLGAPVPELAWAQLNSVVGPARKTNVILVALGEVPVDRAFDQISLWNGGKKNDLILIYGGPAEKPGWAKAFSWSNDHASLIKIEERMLRGVGGPTFIDDIRTLVLGFSRKNWTEFDYLSYARTGALGRGLLWTLLAQALVVAGHAVLVARATAARAGRANPFAA